MTSFGVFALSVLQYWISESGEMCAMKEVTLFSDDTKSKESAKQLGQVCKRGGIYMDVKSLHGYFCCILESSFIRSYFLCFWNELLIILFLQEIILLSRLRHPNIVQYYGSETVSLVPDISYLIIALTVYSFSICNYFIFKVTMKHLYFVFLYSL